MLFALIPQRSFSHCESQTPHASVSEFASNKPSRKKHKQAKLTLYKSDCYCGAFNLNNTGLWEPHLHKSNFTSACKVQPSSASAHDNRARNVSLDPTRPVAEICVQSRLFAMCQFNYKKLFSLRFDCYFTICFLFTNTIFLLLYYFFLLMA
jgi:hypothetical protein